ncbi:hypothetical protein Pmani_020562 [Petrolisthes manimaculis]|uniref:Uncharacterized protein n=1 Tax=Petrolisthes manimaculis TaxID=1843537 RepID=A0AAE1PFG7_9EUCA|nr:hypothetical protein Pmani_020562 [Petrolisthes manimaculis]
MVTAHFPKLRYMEVKLWRKTFLDFINTLGGYTGILLGMSVVTAFEVVICMLLMLNMGVQRISQHRSPLMPRVSPQHQK